MDNNTTTKKTRAKGPTELQAAKLAKKVYDSNKRITVYQRDEKGSIHGVVSINKDGIYDIQYDAIRDEMAVTLKSYSIKGGTDVRWLEKTQVVNKQIQTIKGAYSQHEIQSIQGYNHVLVLKDHEEMEKVWNWADHQDMPFSELIKLRKEIEAKFEEAKRLAEQKEKEKEGENGEQKQESKLVDLQGKPLTEEA